MLKTTFKQYLRLAQVIGDEITSKSLGIDREDMPQVKDYDDFEQFLETNGVKYSYVNNKDPMEYRTAQRHVSNKKIVAMLDKDITKPILVSSDNYIIDGTHRFAVAVMKHQMINVLRVDMKAKELLKFIKNDYYNVSFKKLHEEKTL